MTILYKLLKTPKLENNYRIKYTANTLDRPVPQTHCPRKLSYFHQQFPCRLKSVVLETSPWNMPSCTMYTG